jgi:hypothetical protein
VQGGSDRQYALDLVTFRYAPSAQMLRRAAEADAARESVLLISEPESPLAGSSGECVQ